MAINKNKKVLTMIICQIDARFSSAMSKKDIEHELELLDDVLDALDGHLIGAKVNMSNQRILAYVRAESELAIKKTFECSYFKAERIACLGWHQEPLESIEYDDRSASEAVWLYPLAA